MKSLCGLSYAVLSFFGALNMKRVVGFLFGVLATLWMAAPAAAWLNDSEEPGSVLVFYRFTRGSIQTPDEGSQPRSQFKISVTCPSDVAASPGCAETGDATTGQLVNLVGHWVCPPSDSIALYDTTCVESDFPIHTTVFGTVEFDADGGENLPRPSCDHGYLIVWAEDGFGNRISFNGLIGTAVIRGSGTSWRAYNALPIQSNATTGTSLGRTTDPLHFDGSDYQAITGSIFGGVAYPNSENTKLVLLTLDVLSGQPNPLTQVPLRFYNESEFFLSDQANFTCWGEFPLDSFSGGTLANDPFAQLDGLVRSTGVATQLGSAATVVGVVETRENLTDNVAGKVTEILSNTLLNSTTVTPSCAVTGTGGVVGSCNTSCNVSTSNVCQVTAMPLVITIRSGACQKGETSVATVPSDIACQIVTDLTAPVNLTREYTYPLLNDSVPISTTFVPQQPVPIW